ncbi:FAD-binding protein [Robertmurraya massiliosenegalensis]|uniref:FAD-binding protein n=1 Tax=Robertmurraya TaxID=2837507 RepID=UPI0039A746E9
MSDTPIKEVDVLIIGGGLAALRAAIAAREANASVAVIVKGKFGRSGSSAMTTGGYASFYSELQNEDSATTHYEDTMKAGCYVANPDLVSIMCHEAEQGIKDLEKMGAQFLEESGEYYVEPSGEHSYPRVFLPKNRVGTDFTVPLGEYAKRIGVEPLEFTMAIELLVTNKQVVGSVCVDTKTGELLVIKSGATILATGGCGNLFSFTSNPRDVTGDGFALAAQAGASLRDMEFIQFYPWRCIKPFDKTRVSIQPPTFVSGGKLFNKNGERFMENYDPLRWEGTTRDVAARGIFDQIRKGLGEDGGVRLDLTEMSEEDFIKYNPKMWKGLKSKKIDYKNYHFVIAPEAHYFMGGIEIDENGQSSVQGLYAAGEVAGGIHGANRVNSNALPDTIVFGARAGKHAAIFAKNQSKKELNVQQVKKWLDIIMSSKGKEDSELLKGMKKQFKSQIDISLGIVRTEENINEGLRFIHSFKKKLSSQKPVSLEQFRSWMELHFMCRVAEMSLTSALLRRESRGAHFREDYPEQDNQYERSFYVLNYDENGQLMESLQQRQFVL